MGGGRQHGNPRYCDKRAKNGPRGWPSSFCYSRDWQNHHGDKRHERGGYSYFQFLQRIERAPDAKNGARECANEQGDNRC